MSGPGPIRSGSTGPGSSPPRTEGVAALRPGDRWEPGLRAGGAAREAGLEAVAQDTDMSITVIRPPLIHGPGALGNFRLLVKAAERGIPLPFGSIHNRRAFLGVENLASFIVHRLTHPGSKFDVFLVADDEQVSTPEFVRRIAMAMGRKPRILPFPLFALKALFRMTGRSEASDSVAGSPEADTSKAKKTPSRPPLSLHQGLLNALRATLSS